MPADEEFARARGRVPPCERFPVAAERFTVAPERYASQPERTSPPPPAPIADRFAPPPTAIAAPSPRRYDRYHDVAVAAAAAAARYRAPPRRTRYVPPAAHVPVERYVPRPPVPSPSSAPPFYCRAAPRKCCEAASAAVVTGVEARRVLCTPPPPMLPSEPEPPCCVQARRRQTQLEWRPAAHMASQMPLPCPPPSSAPPPSTPQLPASPPRVMSAPPAPRVPLPEAPPPEEGGQPHTEDGVRLRRAHTFAVRDYLRRETQTFFGVREDCEREQRRLWRERRRRHAARALGDLRPDAVAAEDHADDDEISMYGASGVAPREARGRPDVLPGAEHPRVRRKDSVARLTLTGLAYVVSAATRKSRQGESRQWSRSFPARVPVEPAADADDVFFSLPPGTSTSPAPDEQKDDVTDSVDATKPSRVTISEEVVEWRRDAGSAGAAGGGGTRISKRLLQPLTDNSDRRQYGMGVVGRFFRRSLRKSVTTQAEVRRQLDELTDYRPYFTWWASVVQTLVLVLALACYGFGPVGFGRSSRSGQVLVTSLSLQQVDYQEPASFWLGPRAADLIHLGAKFSPCMRRDARISRAIAASARRERDTACCIRNDDSGCVQSSKADCSNTISTWKKWSTGEAGPGGRISGSVCGLDPKYCEAPASVAPYEWPDDITKWPICRKPWASQGAAVEGVGGRSTSGAEGKGTSARRGPEHMACEVIGHPCCIGVHGHCRITTKEYCDFVRGHFHEEASLCSQVSCLGDVCGMLPFMSRARPDQLYRVWTSMFVHAGALHLAATLALQWLLMRDLEKLAGPLRVAAIYLGSGVAGNLASAIFEPYRAEVGPAGAHFGLLACLVVEVVHAWSLLRHPRRALGRLLVLAALLFTVGLLPWVDNFAHLFGFAFGFLLAYALLPFVTFGAYDRRKKVALVWVCLVSAVLLMAALLALFYAAPAHDCEWCSYFTCLPFAADLCSSQDIVFKREMEPTAV